MGRPVGETPQPRHAAPGERAVPARRRHAAGHTAISAAAIFKTSAVDPDRWTIEAPARCFSDQQSGARSVQGRRARPRRRRRRPLPGPARQRHARTAQADPGARRPPGPRPPRRPGHRRAHVGRQRQGAGRDPRLARSASRRPAGAAPATATSSGCAATTACSRRSASTSPRASPAPAPPPPVGVGRELFAMMRGHCDDAEAGASAMLAAMEAEQMSRTIAVADIGGTHARFALAEVEGGHVVSLGEPVTLKTSEHASFRTAWEEFGRQTGQHAAQRARHGLRRAGRRRIAQADQQPVGDPPGADGGEARGHRVQDRQRFRRHRLCRRRVRRGQLPAFVRAGSAAPARGRDHHHRPRHGPGRRRPAQGRQAHPHHRDRGRPRRLRAARQPRGQDPRSFAAKLPPGVGRADRQRLGAGQHLQRARRDRGQGGDPARGQGAVGGRARRQRRARLGRARPLLPVAWARSPATSRLPTAPTAWSSPAGSASGCATISTSRASTTASSPRAGSSGAWR